MLTIVPIGVGLRLLHSALNMGNNQSASTTFARRRRSHFIRVIISGRSQAPNQLCRVNDRLMHVRGLTIVGGTFSQKRNDARGGVCLLNVLDSDPFGF